MSGLRMPLKKDEGYRSNERWLCPICVHWDRVDYREGVVYEMERTFHPNGWGGGSVLIGRAGERQFTPIRRCPNCDVHWVGAQEMCKSCALQPYRKAAELFESDVRLIGSNDWSLYGLPSVGYERSTRFRDTMNECREVKQLIRELEREIHETRKNDRLPQSHAPANH